MMPCAAVLAAALLSQPGFAQARCGDMPAALATMRSVDQALRELQVQRGFGDRQLDARIVTVDRQNTRQLAALLRRCGWPHSARHGQAASDDAWLLAQHADHDRAFQRRALALLEDAVRSGGARGGHMAFLSERIAVDEGRPQPYGTQFKLEGCKLELLPIDSRAAVNRRRSAIAGMPSLEVYEREIRAHALPPACADLPPGVRP